MGRSIGDIMRMWMKGDNVRYWKYESIKASGDVIRRGCVWRGHDVPLARRMTGNNLFYLFNLDSLHVGYLTCQVRRIAEALGSAAVPVSFSSAKRAKIGLSDINVLYNETNKGYYFDSTGQTYGKSIIKHKGRHFMTLNDDCWAGLVEIEDGMMSWDEAYKRLKPEPVTEWEASTGFVARRQGEWYVIPRPDMKVPAAKRRTMGINLSHGSHLANQYAKIDDREYVRGTLRHKPGETKRSSWHRVFARPWIRMGKCWHELHRANFIASF